MIKAFGVLILAAIQLGVADGATTAFPELCRVMKKYRSCSDQTFRVACPNACTPSGSACGNFIYYKSTGYCYQATDTHTSVWQYALEFCQAFNAGLAPLKSASEADIITELVTISGSSKNEFFVGCINAASTKIWAYTDNTEATGSSSDSNWDSGYPQVTNDQSNCMYVRRGSNFKQRSDTCNQNYGYICYVDPYANSTVPYVA